MNAARLDRALSVLAHLARHPDGQSLSRLAADLGMPVSSTYDLVQALVEIGALRVLTPRVYGLGPRAVTLGLSITDSMRLREIARPHLRALAGEIEENVYLAVRAGDQVVYADRYEASQTLSVVVALGGPRPLHGTAAGKLLAAFDPALEEQVLASAHLEALTSHTLIDRDALRGEYRSIRERGHSVSNGESVEGITSLATPIAGADGTVTAAVAVTAPQGRLGPGRLPFVLSTMSSAGNAVSAQLGGGQPLALVTDGT